MLMLRLGFTNLARINFVNIAKEYNSTSLSFQCWYKDRPNSRGGSISFWIYADIYISVNEVNKALTKIEWQSQNNPWKCNSTIPRLKKMWVDFIERF